PEELGRITATGMIVGTPAYLSPEQAMGQTITPATDIYAFGCMLYEMITGSTPYQGSTVIGIINQHLYMDPPSIKDTHPSLKAPFGLDQLLLSSMRKDPAARPNAALLCEMLSRLLAGAERFQARPGRGRSSQDLQPRHERVGIVTTAVPSSLTETDGFPSELLISTPNASVMDGLEPITLLNHPCDGALAAALAVQGMRGVSVEQVAEVETDVVFAPQVTPDTVRALIASGRWVVTTAHPGDMERIQALIRAGAADVVSPSPTPLKLSRKLSRALRRSKTPKT
ncbi:MAG: protein kinase, partial [Myxococcota bacterium]